MWFSVTSKKHCPNLKVKVTDRVKRSIVEFVNFRLWAHVPCWFVVFFIQDNIAFNAPKRHKLSVHILSTAPKGDNNDKQDTVDAATKDQSSPDIELPQVS
jgi:hypothetical protein